MIKWFVVFAGSMFVLVSPARAGMRDAVKLLTGESTAKTLAEEVQDRLEVVDGTAIECAYNLENDRIEVSRAASEASNEVLAQCLAPAVAQMKYEGIEDRWLKHMGIQQAWVIEKGVPRVIEPAARGIAEPSARAAWIVLATRELTSKIKKEQGHTEGPSRGIASSVSIKPDPTVRELLGI